MSQSAPQPNPQEYLQNLMQAGQNVVQQFEQALSSGNVIAASDLKWPAATPTSVTEMFDLQRRYFEQMGQLWNSFLPGLSGDERKPVVAPPKGDNRFRDEAWQKEPYYDAVKQSYLIGAKFLHDFVEQANVDEKMKMQLRFYARQFTDAISPSNFPMTNPEVIRTAIDTRCESLTEGMKNLMEDIQKGRISMTDESAFEVGENIAITPGEVIYENELIQLIQYKPTTEQVEKRPLLLVPPCINKYYVLDLTPANSFVRYALEQGHPVFLISWRSADESIAHLTWDDYIEKGAIQAIQAVREITGQDRKGGQINTLGFCVGGTILSTALAVLAARGEKPAASVTLLTTFLDFSDTGILDIFVDEPMVQYREMQLGKGGLLPGGDLASTFSFLRPNDLVWNYVVGNYLKGETPPPFDLLYWNSDATNLPGPFYAWYLRNTYHENKLAEPDALTVCGEKIDLRRIDIPAYIYGSREDHIVPIGGAYASTQILPGKKRFVMGASGHIAGVINPPAKNKRSHWIRADGKLPKTQAEWLAGAQEHPGSWWTDWSQWLKGHAGKQIPAPKTYGKGKAYQAIEPAPGRYVKARA